LVAASIAPVLRYTYTELHVGPHWLAGPKNSENTMVVPAATAAAGGRCMAGWPCPYRCRPHRRHHLHSRAGLRLLPCWRSRLRRGRRHRRSPPAAPPPPRATPAAAAAASAAAAAAAPDAAPAAAVAAAALAAAAAAQTELPLLRLLLPLLLLPSDLLPHRVALPRSRSCRPCRLRHRGPGLGLRCLPTQLCRSPLRLQGGAGDG
jgi:hypothetical protein